MKPETLQTTVEEAWRFLRAADRLAKVRADGSGSYANPREQGAVRRSSLDLTRALADLRRA